MQRSADQTATTKFFDHLAKTYRPLARYSIEVLDGLRDDLRDSIATPAVVALDVGAGTGYPSQYVLSGFDQWTLTLLDRSTNMLAEIHRDAENKVNSVVGDACELPFSANTFSLVTTFCAAHCFDSKMRFVEECRRVIRECGTLLIAFNDKAKLNQQLIHAHFPNFHKLDAPRQCEAGEIQKLLNQSGFSVVRCGCRDWNQNFENAEEYLTFIRNRPFSGFSFYTDSDFEFAFGSFRQKIYELFGQEQPLTNKGSLDWVIAQKDS